MGYRHKHKLTLDKQTRPFYKLRDCERHRSVRRWLCYRDMRPWNCLWSLPKHLFVMFILYTLNMIFGFLVWVLAVCCPGGQLFLWGRDFLWLVPERICIFIGKIKQKLSGESLMDKIMLCKKRKSRQRRWLTNSGTKPLDIPYVTISKATTTTTLATSLKFRKTGNAKHASLPNA